MAKLRKRPKSRSELPKSTKSNVRKTDSAGPLALPVVEEQPALNARQVHQATNHQRDRSDGEVRNVVQGRERTYDPRAVLTRANSPAAPLTKMEQPTVTTAQRRPSPLRISQQIPTEFDAVDAGPSNSRPENRRVGCGPSCQKCGRPRKQSSPGASSDELMRASPTNWPLPGPGDEVLPSTAERATEKATTREPQSEPEVLPSNQQRSKRRKYFSLPSKSNPSFKGPTELAASKGKKVEPPTNQEPKKDNARPVSAPSPIKSAFKGPADVEPPKLQPTPAIHVHFASDDHLGRFAAEIRPAADTTSSPHQQVSTSLTAAPARKVPEQHDAQPTTQPPVDTSQQATQPHLEAMEATQPTFRPNSAVLYEWPLITTLVNQPNENPGPRRPTLSNAQSRSSLSISKRQSCRTSRPYHNPHIHAPIPGRTSSRHKALLQQSRKVSYIADQASNSSLDSVSISILGMLQGFPGGELAAIAKTETTPQPLLERPSLSRLQTYPPDGGTERIILNKDAPDEEITQDLYSPSEYGSEEDNADDDGDDDDQPMPVAPPQSDFSLASYAIGDDKKLNLRPNSTVTQTSFSIGDDKNLPLAIASTPPELTPAPAPRALLLTPSPLASPSPSISPPSSHPAQSSISSSPPAPTPASAAPDSEGMIPVSRLSVADLPEVAGDSNGNLDEDDIDPDWFSWGALPGSYGGAGMWAGPSPGLGGGGPAELGAAA